jgi:hypothetical protein
MNRPLSHPRTLTAAVSFVALALALPACESEPAMLPLPVALPDGPFNATVKFCNELDVELTLQVGGPDKAILLVALPHQCSSDLRQPCGRAPTGPQQLTLLRGRTPIASERFSLTESTSTLLMARDNGASAPSISFVRLSSVDSCPMQSPFGDPNDPKMLPADDDFTCRDLKNCHRSCDANAAACHAACDAKATPEVKATFGAVEACVAANGCKDELCVKQKCAAEVSACPAPEPAPELTCRELKNCRLDCQDSVCAANCDAKASAAALAAYTAADACTKANACTDDRCVSEKCGPQVEACLGSS